MSTRSATPLRIDLQPSGFAAGWLLPVHVAGCCVPLFMSLPVWDALLVVPFAASSLAWHWSRHVTRSSPAAVCRLVWHGDRRCTLVFGNGHELGSTLASGAFVMPWMVILHYRDGRWPRSLFVLPDMLDATVFRRLRVRLRTESGMAGHHLRMR